MTHEFELTHDIELAGTPEEVWQAIATGPGVDAWFMGHTEIEPRLGGRGTFTMPGYRGESTVTAWDPPSRFAYRGDPAGNGAFMAFEYLIEGRDGGSTSLRMVHSGALAGDWEEEYDALRRGNPLYLRTLGQYLQHFKGRTAVPVIAFGPPQPDQEQAWAGVVRAAGLSLPVTEGDKAVFAVGDREVTGVVDTVLAPGFLGIRTDDALLRFVGGRGMLLTGHHLFGDAEPEREQQAWSSWLAAAYA